jgi:hypothetical protein
MDFQKMLEDAIRNLQRDESTRLLNALLWWAETRELPTTELQRLCTEIEDLERNASVIAEVLDVLAVTTSDAIVPKILKILDEQDDQEGEVLRLRTLLDEANIEWNE